VLGDDVVIADAQVAEVDFQSFQQAISTQKSLLSYTGAFEFASRFWGVDFSLLVVCLLTIIHRHCTSFQSNS
jgi:hypothetical protein